MPQPPRPWIVQRAVILLLATTLPLGVLGLWFAYRDRSGLMLLCGVWFVVVSVAIVPGALWAWRHRDDDSDSHPPEAR